MKTKQTKAEKKLEQKQLGEAMKNLSSFCSQMNGIKAITNRMSNCTTADEIKIKAALIRKEFDFAETFLSALESGKLTPVQRARVVMMKEEKAGVIDPKVLERFKGRISRLRKAVYRATGSERAASYASGYINEFKSENRCRAKLWCFNYALTSKLLKAIKEEYGTAFISAEIVESGYRNDQHSLVVYYKTKVEEDPEEFVCEKCGGTELTGDMVGDEIYESCKECGHPKN